VRKLPTQLRWSEFVEILNLLNLKKLPNKRGSARHFQRLSDGEVFTFHEPHGNDTIKQGTLGAYLGWLGTSLDKVEDLLGSQTLDEESNEQLYRLTIEKDGTIISNCTRCLEVVLKSKSEEEISDAEAMHACGGSPLLGTT